MRLGDAAHSPVRVHHEQGVGQSESTESLFGPVQEPGEVVVDVSGEERGVQSFGIRPTRHDLGCGEHRCRSEVVSGVLRADGALGRRLVGAVTTRAGEGDEYTLRASVDEPLECVDDRCPFGGDGAGRLRDGLDEPRSKESACNESRLLRMAVESGLRASGDDEPDAKPATLDDRVGGDGR